MEGVIIVPDVTGMAEQARRMAAVVVARRTRPTANEVLWLAGHLCYLASLVAADERLLLEWPLRDEAP